MIPVIPYIQALGLQRDDLVQAQGISFTMSTLALAVVLIGNGTLNTSNAIGTIAAGSSSSRVGAITYADSNALTIGTVNPTGIWSTGDVSITTETGDLTFSQSIDTTSTSATAVTLNAGEATAAGTSTGGNVIISGSPTITMGTGGIARLMTGSISGSTGVTTFVGSGSGRFRYNSDEPTANYTAALTSGKNAIYREQPKGGLRLDSAAGWRTGGESGAVIEPRMHLVPEKDYPGHFNVLRGYIRPMGLAGVKIVGDFYKNYEIGLPSELAMLNLFDPKNGKPIALIDASDIKIGRAHV